MTTNTFRLWLVARIKELGENVPEEWDWDMAELAVYYIRETENFASELGLPDIARRCSEVTTTAWAAPCAKLFLSECLAMLPVDKADFLTPPKIAKMLGVGMDKVLNWIRKGDLKAINTTAKPGGRPRYRIMPEDLETFKKCRMPQPRPKIQKRQPYHGKIYY